MYSATVNLVPRSFSPSYDIFNNENDLQEILNLTGDDFQTICYSVDDALAIVNGEGARDTSLIKIWNANLIREPDLERIQSWPNLEYWNVRDRSPYKVDYLGVLKQHSSKRYGKRLIEQINQIVIHHTVGWNDQATLLTNCANIANYHVNSRNWPGIGYHYVIAKNGLIAKVNDLETVSYHATGENDNSIGIALGGNFVEKEPGDVQIKAAASLVGNIVHTFSQHFNVIPHGRTKLSSTLCPGVKNLDDWIRVVAGTDYLWMS